MKRKKDAPSEADLYAGKQLRHYRTLRRMSQQKLGERIGMTFQQIQKYEKGHNRISVSVLWDISNHLKVSPLAFFPECESPPPAITPGMAQLLCFFAPYEDRDIQAFLRAFALLKRSVGTHPAPPFTGMSPPS